MCEAQSFRLRTQRWALEIIAIYALATDEADGLTAIVQAVCAYAERREARVNARSNRS